MNKIKLEIPILVTEILPNEHQIRMIQSLVTEKLIEFGCLDGTKASLYNIKIKFALDKEE